MSCYAQYNEIGNVNKKNCIPYSGISNLGNIKTVDKSPLAVCAVSGLEAGFNATLGGSFLKPGNENCQIYSAEYCATNWDGVCEYMSKNTNRTTPNMMQSCGNLSGAGLGVGTGSAFTRGQDLIRNAASVRFLTHMSGNCKREYQPFDPTVADSPLISKWVPSGNGCNSQGNCYSSNKCIPIYGVDPKTIDNDVIMNKILAQPWIAMDILVNIYNNAVRSGQIKELVNTKLYKFFMNPEFQNLVKNKKL